LSLQPSEYVNKVEATTIPCDDVAMDTKPRWLSNRELAAWVRLAAVLELLPGVLDSQLRHDAQLTHFEYYALAMLSQAPRRTLRMTELAAQTNATLPRLSHVAARLESRDLVERFPCPEDARATNVRLTGIGWRKLRASAPGHVANVRAHVIDALSAEQIDQLTDIADAILSKLDPEAAVASAYRNPDDPASLTGRPLGTKQRPAR
jgi:DNA-binding MarR family transcriptional regulator